MAKTKNGEDISLTETISKSMKGGFDLDKFKQSKFLNKNVGFKAQEWIPWSSAMQEMTSLPGAPVGHITLLRGHTDTGKTTAMIELAISSQKQGRLPVFIITEMKWSWEHAIKMGLEVIPHVDEKTGEISYSGDFIYIDRGTLNSIEDVAAFINDLFDEQKKGNLPYNLVFLWDSIGSIPCDLSLRSAKNNNEWNAGAMSTQFANNVNQKITLSRKISSTYTNTLICVNKIWVAKAENPMSKPKMKNKNGESMAFDSTLMITFGNITNPGTSKIKATKNGKEVEFAKRTKVQVDKNHINGIQTKGTIIMTTHGFIMDDKKEIDTYKKAHSKEWAELLGGSDFNIIEEDEVQEDIRDILEEETE